MLIKEKYESHKSEVNSRFDELKKNEEELNRIFIDIYGLQDELTPDILDKDITVARIYDTKEEIPEEMKNNIYVETKQDVIKDLISYIVGCLFGRYSVDYEGLVYAGGEWDNTKYKTIIPDKDNILPITDDEYFDDDISLKIVEFIKKVYGEKDLKENLEFVAMALGESGNNSTEIIRNYMLKEFFKDHCKKYQNRPIYWQFDSGKNNGFKALVYLHRYNEDTIAKMRAEYLHRVQKVYENQIAMAQETIDNSMDRKEVVLATKQKEKFTKQLLETKEYDEVLGHIALQRIALDLDDGVKVNYQKFQNIEVVSGGRTVKKNLLVNIFKD